MLKSEVPLLQSKRWLSLQTSSNTGWKADHIFYVMPVILQFKLGKINVYHTFSFGHSITYSSTFCHLGKNTIIIASIVLNHFGLFGHSSCQKGGFLLLDNTEVELGASSPSPGFQCCGVLFCFGPDLEDILFEHERANRNCDPGQRHIIHRSYQLHCPHHI